MVAASLSRPWRSSSNPWPIACAASGAAPAPVRKRTKSALRTRGGRSRRIEPAEVFENEATLLRRQTGQLFPRGILESRPRARRPRSQHAGQVHAVADRRTAGALAVFIGRGARQRAARVEQPAGQPPAALEPLAGEAGR